MSRCARLFALALLLAGAAAVAGCGTEQEHGGGHTATHEEPRGDRPGEELGGGHGEAARGPAAANRPDLELELLTRRLRAGRRGELELRVLDPSGEPVTDLEVEHTKRMHLIVVRRDLEVFHHLHPQPGQDGTWRVPVQLEHGGDYRVIADITYRGRKQALPGDLSVSGRSSGPQEAPREGYDVRVRERDLQAREPVELHFEVRRDGRVIATEPYLGAAGHLVILRRGDLRYLHVHPEHGQLVFAATFPAPGRYVMFLEFKHEGRVHLSRLPVTARG